MKRALWWAAGSLLLLLAPAPKLGAQQPPGTLDQQVAAALAAAGFAVGQEDVGCTHLINGFDVTSVDALLTALAPIRASLAGPYDAVHSGVRVVMGTPGGTGTAPVLGTQANGGAGAAVTLALGNQNMILAIGGDGGDGINGIFQVVGKPVPASYTGGNGGAGGTVSITCGDDNSIVALGGKGGNGGNQGALSGGAKPKGQTKKPRMIGNNGSGGNGGSALVTFNRCNYITAQTGDGGVSGLHGLIVAPTPAPGTGGNGGNATATSPTPPNRGRIEAGAGRLPLGTNGTATLVGAGAAPLIITTPTVGN
jgi:hypothetical protein